MNAISGDVTSIEHEINSNTLLFLGIGLPSEILLNAKAQSTFSSETHVNGVPLAFLSKPNRKPFCQIAAIPLTS